MNCETELGISLTKAGGTPAHCTAYFRVMALVGVFTTLCLLGVAHAAVFNVKDFGASGIKEDDARPAIQKAIETCATARGGTVLLPPGEYTSGTLQLRSHVRLEIAAGATLFASTNPAAYEFGKIDRKSVV